MSRIMDFDTAEQLLENVFAICGKETSGVSLRTLVTLGSYRKQRYAAQRVVSYGILVLFLLLPLMFVVADFVVSDKGDGEGYSLHMEDTLFGESSVTARMEDGSYVAVQVGENGNYNLLPSKDGIMEVHVKLPNRQETVQYIPVSGVDMERPEYIGYRVIGSNEELWVFVRDGDSGVDFSTVTVNGQKSGFRCDEQIGCICLPFPEEDLFISVMDKLGNELELELTLNPAETDTAD